MTLKSLTAAILSLSLSFAAIAINSDHTINEQVEIAVLDARPDGFTLQFNFPEMEFTAVQSGGENFTGIIIPGCGETGEIGKPSLPAFSKLIRLPRTGGYSLNISLPEP
ncbi:MAG: hypothetical protein H8E46_02840, partial [FCB group bacterium]|nr:hypothetical protein [FCB group bacterium]